VLNDPGSAANAVGAALKRADRTEACDDRSQRDSGYEPDVWHESTVPSGSVGPHDGTVMARGAERPDSGHGTHHLARHRSHRRLARRAGDEGKRLRARR